METNQDQFLLHEIFNLIPYNIFWKDVNGNFLGCNESYAKDTGFKSGQDIIGRKITETNWAQETIDFFQETDQEVIKSKKPLLNVELNIKDSQNRVKTLLFSKVPLENKNQQVLGILGVYTDITEQKNNLKAKNKAEKELEFITSKFLQTEKLRSLGLMAGGIAHEINNPLTIISGKASLIKKYAAKNKTEEVMKQCDELIETVNRCSKVIQNLKDFSRQKAQDRISQFLLSKSVSTVKNLVELREDAKGKIEIVERYSDMAISAKKISFEQTLVNIIENAIYEMQAEEKILIYIDNYEGSLNGIRISNPGPPIAKDVLPYIFDPFFTTKPIGEGTGLGLSTCKSLMKSCGGDVLYERFEDMNSFVITLVV